MNRVKSFKWMINAQMVELYDLYPNNRGERVIYTKPFPLHHIYYGKYLINLLNFEQMTDTRMVEVYNSYPNIQGKNLYTPNHSFFIRLIMKNI